MRGLLAALLLGAAAPAIADVERRDRLAEMLGSHAPPGVVDVEFSNCVMTRTVLCPEGKDSCTTEADWWRKTDVLDYRVFATWRPTAESEIEGSTHLRYARSLPFRLLERPIIRLDREIHDAGYDLFPSDVDARLRYFAARYDEELPKARFAHSTTTYRHCNGVVLTTPSNGLRFGSISLFVAPEDRDEFIELMANELSETCLPSIPPQS